MMSLLVTRAGASAEATVRCGLLLNPRILLEEMSLVCGRADLEDGLEGLRVEGADALEAG